MNRIYRIVFNCSAGLWQVVGEHARGHGKSRGRSRALGAMVALAAACGSSPAWAQVTIIAVCCGILGLRAYLIYASQRLFAAIETQLARCAGPATY